MTAEDPAGAVRLACVTGMHRSGTSMVSRFAALLGLNLGPEEELLPATPDNAAGYWEHAGIARLNERLLRHLGGSWREPPALPPGWELRAGMDPFRLEARRLVDRLLAAATGPAGWKDPRACLTLPLWNAVEPIDRVVLVLRHPGEVAGSLTRRDGLDPERSAVLWLLYTSAALRLPMPVLPVFYDDALADPVRVAHDIADHLVLPPPDDRVLADVTASVQHQLRHHTGDSSAASTPMARAAAAMYQGLRAGAGADLLAGSVLAPLGEAFEALHSEHETARRELEDAQRSGAELARALGRSQEDVERLEAALAAQRRQADLARRRAAKAEGELAVLRDRTLVRAALFAQPAVRRGLRTYQRLVRPRAAAPRSPDLPVPTSAPPRALRRATAAEQAVLSQRICDTTPAPRRTRGPRVSIVIPTRDGESHLRRCLDGLVATDYAPFDVVVVDNASSDGSGALLERMATVLPLRVVRNSENRSFSEATNQGVAASEGDLVLLLNNDIAPITPTWLAHMVEVLEDNHAAAVGARLVFPARPNVPLDPRRDGPDLTVQHAGVDFRGGGLPRPAVMGKSTDPCGPLATAVREVPAVTGACLLVRRDALAAVGGLCEDYFYGLEDVDLCIALRAAGGRILYDGGAALYHYELATVSRGGIDRREHRHGNRAALVSRWGPWLYREVLEDLVRGTGRWSPHPLRVGVVSSGRLPRTRQASSAFERDLAEAGRHVEPLGRRLDAASAAGQLDVLVSFDPTEPLRRTARAAVTVAVVTGQVDVWVKKPWFDDYDLVLTPGDDIAEEVRRDSTHAPVILDRPTLDAAGLDRQVLEWAARTRVALCVAGDDGVDGRAQQAIGAAVTRALRARGLPTRRFQIEEQEAEVRARADVVLHLFGRPGLTPRASQLTVLWAMGPVPSPTPAGEPVGDDYDVVWRCASEVDAGSPQAVVEEAVDQLLATLAPLLQARPKRVTPTAVDG